MKVNYQEVYFSSASFEAEELSSGESSVQPHLVHILHSQSISSIFFLQNSQVILSSIFVAPLLKIFKMWAKKWPFRYYFFYRSGTAYISSMPYIQKNTSHKQHAFSCLTFLAEGQVCMALKLHFEISRLFSPVKIGPNPCNAAE